VKILIKIGGTLLDQTDSRDRIAREISSIQAQHGLHVVVVHGGGKQMTSFLAERGVSSRFINGLRVTSPEIIDAVMKVFIGTVNTELVASFRKAGARPVGLSGVSAGLVDAVRLSEDLGQVGRPVRSDPRILTLLTAESFIPIVACVAGDVSGNIFNVNADQLAVACASSFEADKVFFLTDVDGVRGASGKTVSTLTSVQARALIDQGVAIGGMQAKLESALALTHKHHIHQTSREVVIAPGARPNAIQQLLEGAAIGTHITHS
jgi:acetylglutamate kinase